MVSTLRHRSFVFTLLFQDMAKDAEDLNAAASDFASLARELAKQQERKWWQI